MIARKIKLCHSNYKPEKILKYSYYFFLIATILKRLDLVLTQAYAVLSSSDS